MKKSFYSLCVCYLSSLCLTWCCKIQILVLIFGPVHAAQIRLSDSSLHFLVALGESSVPARFLCSWIFLAMVAFLVKFSAPRRSPCLCFVFSHIRLQLMLAKRVLGPCWRFHSRQELTPGLQLLCQSFDFAAGQFSSSIWSLCFCAARDSHDFFCGPCFTARFHSCSALLGFHLVHAPGRFLTWLVFSRS
jgi:hypothetical protein